MCFCSIILCLAVMKLHKADTCHEEMMKPIFFPNMTDFLRIFWRKTGTFSEVFLSGNFAGCAGLHRKVVWKLCLGMHWQGALESKRFRRCTLDRRAMAALKPMCRFRARQCHGAGESRNLSFKFKLGVITLK